MNSDQKIRNFVAGLVSGFISVTICNPLDITRTRLNIMNSPEHDKNKYQSFSHTMSTIYKQQGFKGFYVGYRTNAIAIPLFNSLFFPIYQYTKSYFAQKGYNKYLEYFLSTATAGSICNILTNPIWVIRTRIMVQFLHLQERQYRTASPTLIMFQIIKQEGFKALFKGLSASLMSVSNASIYFMCYETMKDILKIDGEGFNSWNIFLASTVSKILSSTITYPLIVIRTVLHDHKTSHHGNILQQKLSFMDVVRHIKSDNGIHGFYSGLKPDLIRLIPSNAILFVCYEYTKKFWTMYITPKMNE